MSAMSNPPPQECKGNSDYHTPARPFISPELKARAVEITQFSTKNKKVSVNLVSKKDQECELITTARNGKTEEIARAPSQKVLFTKNQVINVQFRFPSDLKEAQVGNYLIDVKPEAYVIDTCSKRLSATKDCHVLVIIPTFNRAHILLDAIESIQGQTHKNWTLIISDDGSEDDTTARVAPYVLKDDRIHYIHSEENTGTYKAQNRALKFAEDAGINFDFFTNVGSDDFCTRDRLEHCLFKYFDNPDTLGLFTTSFRVTHRDLSFSYLYTKHKPSWPGGIALLRRKVFEELGFYADTRMGGDTEYIQRLNKYIDLSRRHKGTKYHLLKAAVDERYYAAYKHPTNENLTYIGWNGDRSTQKVGYRRGFERTYTRIHGHARDPKDLHIPYSKGNETSD